MKCPYCASEVTEDAHVCPHCTRDLYLIKPLLAKVALLEQRLQEIEGRAPREDPEAVNIAPATAPSPPVSAKQVFLDFASAWLSPLLLLLFAHFLIVIVLDAHTLWLRLVSLLIPLPFAYLLMSRRGYPFLPWCLAAFIMAGCAVLGMSWITSLADHTSVLPQDRREWREFGEYAASVGFSFMTGMLLGRMRWERENFAARAERAQGVVLKLAKLLTAGQESAEKVQAAVKRLRDTGNSVAAAATTVAAAYTGMQNFWGS